MQSHDGWDFLEFGLARPARELCFNDSNYWHGMILLFLSNFDILAC